MASRTARVASPVWVRLYTPGREWTEEEARREAGRWTRATGVEVLDPHRIVILLAPEGQGRLFDGEDEGEQ